MIICCALFVLNMYLIVCLTSSEMEVLLLELTRVIAERDMLAAQIKADAITMSDKIQQATKQGSSCIMFFLVRQSIRWTNMLTTVCLFDVSLPAELSKGQLYQYCQADFSVFCASQAQWFIKMYMIVIIALMAQSETSNFPMISHVFQVKWALYAQFC